jgi:hypothetical protein
LEEGVQTTIAKIPADFFEPPLSRGMRHRRFRRRIALTLIASLVVAIGGWGTYQYTRHDCRGLAWPDTRLSHVDGECIGWTDEQAFAFAPNLRDITEKIATENRDVHRRADNGGPNYVKVAVLMPMTTGPGSAMSALTILHAMQGVYIAQRRANASADFGSPNPLIQLILMNEGRSESHWPEMLRALAAMRTGGHPVVAVAGLGVSIPATQDAAGQLSNLNLPAIGGVLTATTLSAPQLFEVSPSNEGYVLALSGYLRTRPNLRTAVLAYDTNNDNYVRSLRMAFDKQLASYIRGRVKGFIGSLGTHDATSAIFDDVKQDACYTNADMIFYAGRDRDLPRLIDVLAHRRECGHQKPIVILSGSTGLSVAGDSVQTMTEHQITIIDASSADPDTWHTHARADAPAGFDAFYRAFTGNFPDTDLTDGYALGHHDAVATAVWAIRRFALQAPGRIPSGTDILGQIINLNEGAHAVPAAGGTLTFDDASGGWPHGKKIAIIQIPTAGYSPPSYTTP